jgi:hypothetical protein
MSPKVAAAADSLRIIVGIAQKRDKTHTENLCPAAWNEIPNGISCWAGIKTPYISPAAISGIAACQRRFRVLSECQPLMSVPRIPIRAGITRSEVTARLGNPERRLTKVGIQ